MEKRSFIRGAAILGIAGLFVQILGAVFRIPLGNIIGSEGMGYYQTAYPIYVFLLVFSTNGAPAAISKMVSERLARNQIHEAYRVFQLSFILMAAFGLVAAALFYFGAHSIVALLGNPGAYYSMIAISPALLFVPIMAAFRGYFQGMQRMEPTAVSQLCEQVVRVGVGLMAAYLLVPVSIEASAAGASIGTSVGPIFGTAILFVIYLRHRKGQKDEATRASLESDAEERESASSILKTLATIAIPVTIGVSIFPIMNIADVLVVMRRLQSLGYSHSVANELYGELSGMAGPIVNVPQALALSIALSLVPAIAAASSTGNRRELEQNISIGLRTSAIIGVPCTFGLMVLAQPILLLLYPLQAESAVSAAPCLFYQGAGVLFLSLSLAMAGMIQGIGRPGVAASVLGVGFIVKILSTYLLLDVEVLGVAGAALGNTIALAVIAIFNYIAIVKMTGYRADVSLVFVKPIFSGVVMAGCVWVVYRLCYGFLGNSLSAAVSIGVGAIVYFGLLILVKGVTAEELETVPMGGKLARLLRKMKRM